MEQEKLEMLDQEAELNDEEIEETEPKDTNEETDEEGQTEETEEVEEKENFYNQEQVESVVKARVKTFNRKIDKLKPYEAVVKKISDVTGLSADELITRLEGMSLAEQANILGITPQQLQERKQITQSQIENNKKTMELQKELEKQKLLANPQYKDYTLYEEEINELLDENPKLSLKQAYTLVKGDIGVKAAARDAEQRAVAKMTKSSNQKVIMPGLSPSKTAPKIDAATISAAKKVGMDPLEYVAYSKMSSLDDYEAMKSKK